MFHDELFRIYCGKYSKCIIHNHAYVNIHNKVRKKTLSKRCNTNQGANILMFLTTWWIIMSIFFVIIDTYYVHVTNHFTFPEYIVFWWNTLFECWIMKLWTSSNQHILGDAYFKIGPQLIYRSSQFLRRCSLWFSTTSCVQSYFITSWPFVFIWAYLSDDFDTAFSNIADFRQKQIPKRANEILWLCTC